MRSTTAARIARRRTLHVAAAVLTAAAALTLTACNGSDTGDTKSAGQADTAPARSSNSSGSSAGAQGSDTKANGGSEAGTAENQSGSGRPASEGGGRAHAGVERCHTQDLEAAFATGEDALPVPEEGADGATTATITLINKGSSSCRIGGFPGVDLTSVNGGERWSLVRSSQKWSSVEVEAGQSTEFTLNLAFTKEEEGFYQPAWVEITPPNETKALKIEWPWETDTLVDQRGATHPGTFVNPIG
ncbi:flagellar motor protein MotB [Streptomyces albus subsp. albus]|nr:flagellar motor protein MotB [Streptomyces albus subsp. albus]